MFLSWVKNGMVPVMSVGPSWPFSLLLFIFAGLAVIYVCFMLRIIWKNHTIGCLLIIGLCVLNIICLLAGILADPGVPIKIYHRYSKHYNFKLEPETAYQEEDDEEACDA